jgi:hypothetical protein
MLLCISINMEAPISGSVIEEWILLQSILKRLVSLTLAFLEDIK